MDVLVHLAGKPGEVVSIDELIALIWNGRATDGSVYWKDFDGQQWGEWGKISDDSYSAYEIYAIDWDGYNNVFWHSPQDTLDKLSPESLGIVGDVMLETARLLPAHK